MTDLNRNSAAANLNDKDAVRNLIVQAIRNSSKSRDQIADEMSSSLRVRVTRRALDLYTAESAEQNRFPFEYARAFAQASGSDQLIRWLAEAAGLIVISEADRLRLELGRLLDEQKSCASRITALRKQLEGVVL